MKLDKIKFAQLISYITNITGYTLDNDQVASIDATIDITIPEPPMMNPEQLHVLMALMQKGGETGSKIEAIKQYRMMTGYGLKESKDIIEKYWPRKNYSKDDLMDILNKDVCGSSTYQTVLGFLERLT